jgi:hypothetical protein
MNNPIATLINRWQAKRRAKKEEQEKIAAAWRFYCRVSRVNHTMFAATSGVYASYVNDLSKTAYVIGFSDGKRYVDYVSLVECGKVVELNN